MDAIEKRALHLLCGEIDLDPEDYDEGERIEAGEALRAIIAALTPQWQPIETLDSDEVVITWHDFGGVNQNTASPHFGKTGYSRMQQRFGGRLFPSEACETGFVTHWQPLPAPPEVKP